MQVRSPDIQPDQGEFIWSRVPEFSLSYNAYSVVIPYVEHYLNSIMNEVKAKHCENNPGLKNDLDIFIKQELHHARFHMRYNKRMFDRNIPGLKALTERVTADLKKQRETRSLAFNVAYCAGFESIATFDSVYIWLKCDKYFEGADPHGANLLLWHVAGEFEHRAVCHDAFHAVSGSYFQRIAGLLYAFYHVGGAFMEAEKLVLDYYLQALPKEQRAAAQKRSKRLFWRQIRYVGPRMLRIFLPGYNPVQVKTPARIKQGLNFFNQAEPITKRAELALLS